MADERKAISTEFDDSSSDWSLAENSRRDAQLKLPPFSLIKSIVVCRPWFLVMETIVSKRNTNKGA